MRRCGWVDEQWVDELRSYLPLALTTMAAVAVASIFVFHGGSEAETFDFVIVGGGSTGSVVAGRLGQAGYSVLLLEAGGATQQSLGGTQAVAGRRTIFDVPLSWVQILSDHRWSKQFQWDVPADPSPAIARGLGGCGIHNAMLYMRGRPEDFATWGPGWSWEDVLPYYKRSEANRQHATSHHHATDGPVSVTDVSSDNISRAFVQSCQSAGLPSNDDFNGESRDGAGFYQFMIRDGVRDSAAAAFLGERSRPKSVTVRTHALVSRVLFDNDPRSPVLGGRSSSRSGGGGGGDSSGGGGGSGVSGGGSGSSGERSASTPPSADDASSPPSASPTLRHAVGVEYVRGKNPTEAARRAYAVARYEVVLSAGAVLTPKLLLLSGIGDRAALERLRVPIVHHNPSVGRGLADGVYAIMQWASRGGDFVRCRLDSYGRAQEDAYCREQLEKYAAHDPASVFASPGMSAGAFLRSPYARGEEPDVQLTLHPWDKYGRTWAAEHREIASMEIANNHPRSRGRIALRSAHFADPPIFDGPYLVDQNDSQALLWAVRQVRRIASTPPLNGMLTSELIPGPRVKTDAQLHDSIACGPPQFRQLGRAACDRSELPVNHLAGTCRLGRPTDRSAVVDLQLRVLGVRGLRVADASVMPRPPSGNTHATCMMIGERAADFILSDRAAAERSGRPFVGGGGGIAQPQKTTDSPPPA